MVEAPLEDSIEQQMKSSYVAEKNENTIPEDEVIQDIVIKPRNGYTESALRRLVSQTNVKLKKESLS